jgi:hypothetical protein
MIRMTEDAHVVADFHQQHSGADQIDARQGLQQHQAVVLILQAFEQTGIEAGDARLQLFDVPHQFIENEAMAVGEIPLQGIEQFLPASLQPTEGPRGGRPPG